MSETVEHKTGLQLLEEYLRGERPPSGMMRLIEATPLSVARGRVAFRALPKPAFYNSGGTVHGGYTATLLDSAMGCAAQSLLEAGQRVTTLELKIAYHRAVTEATGPIEAIGTVITAGRRVIFTEARLNDQHGRPLASGTSTLMILTG